MGAATVDATGENRLKDGGRIGDTRLFGRRAGPRVKLLAILESLRPLLIQSVLLRQHIHYQIDLVPHTIATILATLIVAEVAERGYFVHVAFKLDHSRRRSILYNKLNRGQALEDSAPLGSLRLQLDVHEVANTVHVSSICEKRAKRGKRIVTIG